MSNASGPSTYSLRRRLLPNRRGAPATSVDPPSSERQRINFEQRRLTSLREKWRTL